MPHTLTLVVRKKYALTLCDYKAKCSGTRRPVLKIARSPFSFESLHEYTEREKEERERKGVR